MNDEIKNEDSDIHRIQIFSMGANIAKSEIDDWINGIDNLSRAKFAYSYRMLPDVASAESMIKISRRSGIPYNELENQYFEKERKRIISMEQHLEKIYILWMRMNGKKTG